MENFNWLSASYDCLRRQYASFDEFIDRLAVENRGLKQVATDYGALCRGYGADKVEEQVRAIRVRKDEQKRPRRMMWKIHSVRA